MALSYNIQNIPGTKRATLRADWNAMGRRVRQNLGVVIPLAAWNPNKQRMRKGFSSTDGLSHDEVNLILNELAHCCEDYSRDRPSEQYDIPMMKEFLAEAFDGACRRVADLRGGSVRADSCYRPDRRASTSLVLADYDQYLRWGRDNRHWSEGTYKHRVSLRNRLACWAGDGLRYSSIDNAFLDSFLAYLQGTLRLSDDTAYGNVKMLKEFLRWGLNSGAHTCSAWQGWTFRRHETGTPIIHLTMRQLKDVYSWTVPENGDRIKVVGEGGRVTDYVMSEHRTLSRVKDLLCFCSFTGLRYSDLAALRKSDVVGGVISLRTKKTHDDLKIDLAPQAAEILSRYGDTPGDRAFPVMSNQKMNMYVKELMMVYGLNDPVTRVRYYGGRRVDETLPMWRLVSTHTGRKTFVCCALEAGVEPAVIMKITGHSSFEAMRPYIDIMDSSRRKAIDTFAGAFDNA